LLSKGDVDAVNTDRIRAALEAAPLEDEPFTFAAAAEFGTAHPRETEQLLRIALRRNPRSREARIYLLELLVNEGRVTEAVEQIEILSRLMPERRGFFQSNLLFLATSPETRSEALASITEKGARLDLISSLANAGASSSMVLDTYQSFDGLNLGDDADLYINRWTAPLIQREDYNGAKRIWAHFYPDAKSDALIFDDAFSGMLGSPFGWTVKSSSRGYAKFGKRGLVGEYYGRGPAPLAEQLLLLPPGGYQISFAGVMHVEAVQFFIKCIDGVQLIRSGIAKKSSLAFEVPAIGCEAQHFEIVGRPTEPPRSFRFEIGSIALDRVAS